MCSPAESLSSSHVGHPRITAAAHYEVRRTLPGAWQGLILLVETDHNTETTYNGRNS